MRAHDNGSPRYELIGAGIGLLLAIVVAALWYRLATVGVITDVDSLGCRIFSFIQLLYLLPFIPVLQVYVATGAEPERFALGFLMSLAGPVTSFLLWPVLGAICGWVVGRRKRYSHSR